MIVPHDVADLYLAPVMLAVEARLNELGRLGTDEIATEIALAGNLPDWTRSWRERALRDALRHSIRLHGWELEIEGRGLGLSHGERTVVIAMPEALVAYLIGSTRGEPASR